MLAPPARGRGGAAAAFLFTGAAVLGALYVIDPFVLHSYASRLGISIPAELLSPSYTLCTGLHGLGQTACQVQHRGGKRARHLARMQRCEWQFQPLISYKMQFLSVPPDVSTVETCIVEEKDGEWMFFRLGPVTTRGGYSWENVLSVFDDSLLAPWMHDGKNVMVRDFILGSANADSELVPHPPLHQHHFHFYFDTNLNHMALNNHGDSDCNEQQEGVYCQYMEYPPEVAFYLPSKIGIVSTVNDVRLPNSPALQWYFFAGIQMPKPVTPRPRPMTLQNIYLAPKDFMHSQEQYPVDSTTESILWTSGEVRNLDSVITGWFHLHREVVDELWVIQGTAETLKLAQSPWAAAREAFVSSHGIIFKFKDHLRTRMREHLDSTKLLCAIGQEADFLQFRRRWCQFDPPPGGHLRYVYVGFYRPRRPHLDNPYKMHSGFYLHTTTTDDEMTASNVYWERRPQYDAIVYALAAKLENKSRPLA